MTRAGIEPATFRLNTKRSPTELTRHTIIIELTPRPILATIRLDGSFYISKSKICVLTRADLNPTGT